MQNILEIVSEDHKLTSIQLTDAYSAAMSYEDSKLDIELIDALAIATQGSQSYVVALQLQPNGRFLNLCQSDAFIGIVERGSEGLFERNWKNSQASGVAA